MVPRCIRCKNPQSSLNIDYHLCERCKYPVCYNCVHHVNGQPRCPDCVRLI